MADISTNPPTKQASLRRCSEFYFEDLYLRVENTLFKVLRREFEIGSDVFRGMFQLPTGGHDVAVEGASPERPLVLEGVRAEDMKQFLGILYPPATLYTASVRKHRPKKTKVQYGTKPEQWITVLRLAHMWNFDDVQKEAILELNSANPAIKIHVYDLYPELVAAQRGWLLSAYIKLVTQEKEIELEEAELVTVPRALKISVLRGEYRLFHRPGEVCEKIVAKIRQRFEEPLSVADTRLVYPECRHD